MRFLITTPGSSSICFAFFRVVVISPPASNIVLKGLIFQCSIVDLKVSMTSHLFVFADIICLKPKFPNIFIDLYINISHHFKRRKVATLRERTQNTA